jgi:hypothetical protein
MIVALAVPPLWSQEGLSGIELSEADIIVVGTLHHDFRFPWLDGWNERGYIQVERVLF